MYEFTGLTDKTGKPINVGDVLQISLNGGQNPKHGGPKLKRVIKFGKHFQLVDADLTEAKYGGSKLDDRVAANAVIVDSPS